MGPADINELQELICGPRQINPYMSNPCHIELILTEGEEVVQKNPQAVTREKVRINSRQRGARVRRAITSGEAEA